jgi:hypothetical protein
MAYTAKTIHSGNQGGGSSTKNAQDLVTVLEDMETALADVVAAAAVTPAAAATAEALTGTLTGTNDGALTDITFNSTWSQAQADEINSNFEEFQAQLTNVLADIASIRTAVNAIITALA